MFVKKCINILLAVFLFLNSGGFIIIYYRVHSSVRDEVFRKIKKETFSAAEISCFKIKREKLYKNTGDIYWCDENEFEYRGRLFDIININYENDSAVLYAINDLDEEKIIKSFNGQLNELAGGDLKLPGIKTSMQNLVLQGLVNKAFKLQLAISEQIFFGSYDNYFIKSYHEIPVPPPKAVVT